jgi:hypothetical protein
LIVSYEHSLFKPASLLSQQQNASHPLGVRLQAHVLKFLFDESTIFVDESIGETFEVS